MQKGGKPKSRVVVRLVGVCEFEGHSFSQLLRSIISIFVRLIDWRPGFGYMNYVEWFLLFARGMSDMIWSFRCVGYLGVLANNERVMYHEFASTGLCVCRCKKDNDYLFGLCF